MENYDALPALRPSPGYLICEALYEKWWRVRMPGPAYDPSQATDLAVQIRRHPVGHDLRPVLVEDSAGHSARR